MAEIPDQQVAIPETEAFLTISDLSPQIAAELAAELSSPTTIRKRYGLTHDQWEMLKRNRVFREMLKEAIGKFRGDLNAGARITLKAEVLLEDAMPDLYNIAKNALTPASERINAIKELRELSGRNAKKTDGAAAGGGFVLNINLSNGQKGITIDGRKVEDDNG